MDLFVANFWSTDCLSQNLNPAKKSEQLIRSREKSAGSLHTSHNKPSPRHNLQHPYNSSIITQAPISCIPS
jgi:hypothetical protein